MYYSTKQPIRIVTGAVKGLIFAPLILCLGMADTPVALASGIQMLPPVTEATKTAINPMTCPAGTASLLTWDGTNPLSCATGVTASEGRVGIGTTGPGTKLAVVDTSGPLQLTLNGSSATGHIKRE